MIEIVIDQLVSDLQPLSGIFTRRGGLVRVQKEKATQGAPERRYPVVKMTAGDCEQGDYMSMAPDSKEKGIIYFQLVGRPVTVQVLNGVFRQDTQVRVVAWFNKAKVSQEGSYLAMNVVSLLKKRQPSISNFITSITVTFTGMDEKSADIFSAFTYDEGQSQFLMHPYDFFSFTIEVGYLFTPSCAPYTTSIENECA